MLNVLYHSKLSSLAQKCLFHPFLNEEPQIPRLRIFMASKNGRGSLKRKTRPERFKANYDKMITLLILNYQTSGLADSNCFLFIPGI